MCQNNLQFYGNNYSVEQEMSSLEITRNKNFIEVWLTNAEQKTVDRKKMTDKLLTDNEKSKIIFFLSGSDDLIDCTSRLLIRNI